MTFVDRIKQKIWGFVYKFFPSIQKNLLRWHIIFHRGRQKYHIGWFPPGKTLEELKKHLNEKWGFGNHFIAWVDENQVFGWRKLVSFKEQYHVRVFEDGEIRGHFEFTPEAHPIKHFREIGEKETKQDFFNFLGDFVQEEKYISHLKADPDAFAPGSEITIENQEIYKTLVRS
jgi:hypothetical protein